MNLQAHVCCSWIATLQGRLRLYRWAHQARDIQTLDLVNCLTGSVASTLKSTEHYQVAVQWNTHSSALMIAVSGSWDSL